MRIGLISDTHGLLRPEATAALAGSALIIHAGDVGNPGILDMLREIAPTFAVRGNIDTAAWADALPESITVEAGASKLHVVHRIQDLSPGAMGAGVAAVVFGHSHQPSIEWRDGVLFCNPGSAGPRRFKLPVTLATIDVVGSELWPEIVPLL
jgi:hypothetical protein